MSGEYLLKEYPCCELCGGDGIARCTNPDHGFLAAFGGELSRLGCPVCGHDPFFRIKGEFCDGCLGTGYKDGKLPPEILHWDANCP